MSTPQKANFGELLSQTILPKVHLISLLVSAIGLVFHFLNLNGKVDILTIGFSSLAAVYFLSAFTRVSIPAGNQHSTNALLLYKLIYISTSVILIGVLFYILQMEGYQNMLMIGCGTLGIGVLGAAILVGTNKANMVILKRPLIIGLPMILLGAYFLYQISIA
jgi:hypothetical protein